MKKYLKYLFLILPVLAVSSSFYFLGRSDAVIFITWYLTFFIAGLVFLPLTVTIFKSSGDFGYSFSKPLAMCISAFTMWTLSYIKILPFRYVFVLLIVLAYAAFFYLMPKFRNNLFDALKAKSSIRTFALQETLFAAGLLYWSFARGLKPLLDSLEKPMNYGFMMSIMRSDYLPAADMWYSQGSINYYYFGQYIYTFFTKLSGLDVEVTYNLSMAATFALTLTLSFSVCRMLADYAIQKGSSLYKATPTFSGLLGAFLVTLAGNSHSFFYGTRYSGELQKDLTAPGYKLMEFLQQKGLLDKWNHVSRWADESGEEIAVSIKSFWFANSTRFIGYNPPTKDKTIHEFPFYSFLVADLHAHLINLTFVLLFIGILIAMVRSSRMSDCARDLKLMDVKLNGENKTGWLKPDIKNISDFFLKLVKNPVFILMSVILGTFMMCNFWDFAIYLVVLAMALLIINLRGFGKLAGLETLPVFLFQIICIMVPFLFISNPLLAVAGYAAAAVLCFASLTFSKDAFTVTASQLSLVFFISHLVILPFNMNFDPMSKSIALTVNRTPLFQLLVLWGIHVLVGLLFLLYIVRRRFVHHDQIGGNALYAKDKVSRFFAGLNPFDFFACGLFVCGLIFVLMPEIIYVVDIYSGDFKRANTMFKFTYQAFVMLSIVMGYAITRILLTKPSSSRLDFRWSFAAVFMCVMLILPSYYTQLATRQWLGEFKLERYQGLNGIEKMPDKDKLETIRWINENIEGRPVFLESYGDSYTDYNYLTAFTGLPTVMGWQTHQWLWRTSRTVKDAYNEVVRPRQMDVQKIYEFSDTAEVLNLIRKYEIEYIAVGSNEHNKFGTINEEALKGLGNIVFETGSIYIIKITPNQLTN